MDILQSEQKKGDCFLFHEITSKNALQKVLYISGSQLKRFHTYEEDVLLVDSTFKCNRFNLPMVNFIFIDNHGRNNLLGYALVDDETEETYIWIFQNLSSILQKHPQVILSDECPSIAKGNE